MREEAACRHLSLTSFNVSGSALGLFQCSKKNQDNGLIPCLQVSILKWGFIPTFTPEYDFKHHIHSVVLLVASWAS